MLIYFWQFMMEDEGRGLGKHSIILPWIWWEWCKLWTGLIDRYYKVFYGKYHCVLVSVPSDIAPSEIYKILMALLILLSLDWSKDVRRLSSFFLLKYSNNSSYSTSLSKLIPLPISSCSGNRSWSADVLLYLFSRRYLSLLKLWMASARFDCSSWRR